MGKQHKNVATLDLADALAETEARLGEAVAEHAAAEAARAAIDLVTSDDDAVDRLDQAVEDARRREERARERREAIMARLGTQAADAAEAARLARRRATIASRDKLAATAPTRYAEARRAVLDLIDDLRRDAAAIEAANAEAAAEEEPLMTAEDAWRNRPPIPDRVISDEVVPAWCFSRSGRRIIDPETVAEIARIGEGLGTVRSSGSPVEERLFRRRIVVPGRPPEWARPLAEIVVLPIADPEPLPPEAAAVETWTPARIGDHDE